jgi:hypothetical protein
MFCSGCSKTRNKIVVSVNPDFELTFAELPTKVARFGLETTLRPMLHPLKLLHHRS